MAKVILQPGESVDSALRRFRDVCKQDRVFQEIRKREAYQKPSDYRRETGRRADQRFKVKQNRAAAKEKSAVERGL